MKSRPNSYPLVMKSSLYYITRYEIPIHIIIDKLIICVSYHDTLMKKSNANNFSAIALLATVLGLALLFAGPVGIVGSSAFAQEASKEGQATTTAAVTEPTKEGTEGTTTTTTEAVAPEEPAKEGEAATTTEAAAVTEAPVEPQVLPMPEEGVNAQPRPTIPEPTGNAFLGLEQILDPAEECFAVIEALGVTLVQNTIEQASPEVEQAIDAGAEQVAETVPTEQVPAEVTTAVEEIVVELESNETTAEIAPAVEASVSESAVVETVAENQIVEEIIELEGAAPQVDAVVVDAVESVITGEATAEEAVTAVSENITAIAEGIEVTPEDVQTAVEVVQSEGGEGVVEELAPAETTAAVSEPAKEGEAAPTATEVEVAAETDVVVEQTVVEAVPEIAEQSGLDAQTVLDYLNAAQANIDAARGLLG